jgi:hypothetical protein
MTTGGWLSWSNRIAGAGIAVASDLIAGGNEVVTKLSSVYGDVGENRDRLLAFIEAQGGEAADTRAYNRRMKELAAEDAARGEGLLSKVFGFFFSKSRRY